MTVYVGFFFLNSNNGSDSCVFYFFNDPRNYVLYINLMYFEYQLFLFPNFKIRPSLAFLIQIIRENSKHLTVQILNSLFVISYQM